MICFNLNFNPRTTRPFLITQTTRGVVTTPPGVSKRKVVELSGKKTTDCSQRDLAIVGIFFGSRSTFDLLMTGQRSIFGEIDVFQLYKTIATKLWQMSP